jgi:polysaccharide biosynthesis transport protein
MLDRTNFLKKDSRPAQGAGLRIQDIVHFFWRQWKLISGITLVFLLIGTVIISRQASVYTSTTQVLLEPHKDKTGKQDINQSEASLDLATIESQLSIARSSVLLRRVVEKNHLIADPEFAAPLNVQGWSITSLFKTVFSRSGTLDTTPGTPEQLANQLIGTIDNLRSALTVKRDGQGYVIEISINSSDPVKAARLANDVADAFVVDKLDARFEAAKRASGWLTDRSEELRKQLHDSEQAVADFRMKNNLTHTNAAPALTQEQISQLNARLVAARADVADKKTTLDMIEKIKEKGGSISSMPDVVASTAMVELRKQQVDASRREADLLSRYSDRHPAVINVRAELSDIRRGIANELKQIAQNTENAYELALSRRSAVETALQDVTGSASPVGGKTAELKELERTAAVNKSMFEDFLQRARVNEEQSNFDPHDARIITPAIPAISASAPRKSLFMLGTLLFGLMAGVVTAFASEQMNAGFTSSRQLESMLEVPMLASISEMQPKDLQANGRTAPIPFLPIIKPLSRFSESVRALRSGLQMSDVDNPPKVIQLTSTMPGEGKTTLSLTIASSAAQSGQRAILIDADLRHPSASRFFGRDKEPGLVDYLIGTATLESVIKFEESTRYWVLPAGSKTQNAPDLLASERWKALVDLLRTKFDLVIVDTPPTGPVIDPGVVSQSVDKIVFVVRWSSTVRDLVQEAVRQLNHTKKVAGVVFNHVDDNMARKYGKYAYAYYYGSRYYTNYYSEDR